MSYEAWLGHIDQCLDEALSAAAPVFHIRLTGDTLTALRPAGHYRSRGLPVVLTGISNTTITVLYLILLEGPVANITVSIHERILESSLPRTAIQYGTWTDDVGTHSVVPFQRERGAKP